MSLVTRFLPFGLARGLAALLAVLLSAVIGGRLGVERLSLTLTDDDNMPIACPVAVDQPADLSAIIGDTVLLGAGEWAVLVADVSLPTAEPHHPFPGLLRGSAGGARAP
jgi:hypothetical protein